jgi:uncharacterized membrane protein
LGDQSGALHVTRPHTPGLEESRLKYASLYRSMACMHSSATVAASAATLPPLWRQLTWWALAFPVVMLVAIARRDVYLLNWIHVLSGALWTGADLFMGFILGPVLRALDIRSRTALIAYLVPRTLLYFPMVSLTAGTAGWFLADWFGYTSPGNPMFGMVVVSLALVALMTVMGIGLLLPNSLRIWVELRRPEPNRERIVRINRFNIWLAGTQGVLPVALILVMAKYVS